MSRFLFITCVTFILQIKLHAQPYCDCDSLRSTSSYKGFCAEYLDAHWQPVKKHIGVYKRYRYFEAGTTKKLYGKETYLRRFHMVNGIQHKAKEPELLNGTYSWYSKYDVLMNDFYYKDGFIVKLIDHGSRGYAGWYYKHVKNIAEYDYNEKPFRLHYIVFHARGIKKNVVIINKKGIWQERKTISLLRYDLIDTNAQRKNAKPDSVYNQLFTALNFPLDVRRITIKEPFMRLPLEIGLLVNLTQLNCYENTLQNIPEEIGNLRNLEQLFLSSNKLRSLPDSLEHLQHLKFISIMDNQFAQFPVVLTKLVSLTKIHAQANHISYIPTEIGNLLNLEELTFYANPELTSVPDQIGKLQNLKRLNFGNCTRLRSLPSSIKNLKKLEYLNLSYTKLKAKDVEEIRKALPGCKIELAGF